MFFKWVLGYEEAIAIPGMVHGVAGFILFVLVALLTAWALKWDLKTTFLALVSSVPPFGTIVFERWAVRTRPSRRTLRGPEAAKKSTRLPDRPASKVRA